MEVRVYFYYQDGGIAGYLDMPILDKPDDIFDSIVEIPAEGVVGIKVVKR